MPLSSKVNDIVHSEKIVFIIELCDEFEFSLDAFLYARWDTFGPSPVSTL
jgi:hypothetical protein